MNDNFRPVYSSDQGRLCPDCGKAVSSCICAQGRDAAAGDGIVRIRRESKGRGGKTVTLVTGVPLDAGALKALGKELKRRCGTGGTVKDGLIEIQGDHTETLMAELHKRGYTVKRTGG